MVRGYLAWRHGGHIGDVMRRHQRRAHTRFGAQADNTLLSYAGRPLISWPLRRYYVDDIMSTLSIIIIAARTSTSEDAAPMPNGAGNTGGHNKIMATHHCYVHMDYQERFVGLVNSRLCSRHTITMIVALVTRMVIKSHLIPLAANNTTVATLARLVGLLPRSPTLTRHCPSVVIVIRRTDGGVGVTTETRLTSYPGGDAMSYTRQK